MKRKRKGKRIFVVSMMMFCMLSQTCYAEEKTVFNKLVYPEKNGTIITVDCESMPVFSEQTSQDQTGKYHLSWGVASMQADTLAEYVASTTEMQESITIGVIDSGVSADHPLLKGRVLAGYDYVNNDFDSSDDSGHGTHVAGIIADCTQGLDIKILPVKVLNERGKGFTSDIANGIRYAVENGAKIINLSLAGARSSIDYYIDDAIKYALSKGVIVVAAAGNNNTDTSNISPANRTDIIVVSAINKNLQRCEWGSESPNYGMSVDVVAPGEKIISCAPLSHYSNMICCENGTSMAAPHITSAVAMIKMLYPTASPERIENIIKGCAMDLGTEGYDISYGYGIPQLSELITNLPFHDVQIKDWYYESVKDVYAKGLMTGREKHYFGVAENMQRQDIAVLMYRMAGSPLVQYRDIYSDVSKDSYFANAAVWNYENGIIMGQKDKLGVGSYLLRQDFANILYRYANYEGMDTSLRADLTNYSDAMNVSPWAKTAVEWAVANGLMGQNVTELKPLDNINRAEIATIISRFMMKFQL